MLKIRLSNLSLGGVIMRFYLMMAVAIVLGFLGQWIAMAFIAGPIGASAIMGMSFSFENPTSAKTGVGKIIQMDWGTGLKKAS